MLMPYIVDKNISASALTALKNYDEVILTADFVEIYEPVNTHPDIQIHFVNRRLAYCLKECYDYYKKLLPKYVHLFPISEETGALYPKNVMLNIAVFGKNIVCNIKYADKEVINYYRKENYRIIDVNQGYAKCNIYPVSDNAVITEDSGIAKTLGYYSDIDVCFLNSGDVRLKNFSYGFIGGAGGILCDGVAGFYGELHKYKQKEKIVSFLSKHNISYKELGSGGLTDFGSILSF